MFYREAGDYKTSYQDDGQTFPIKFDRYRYYFVLFVAFAMVPFLINDYWVNAIFLPFLIYSIAAIGLNILVGYCGQVSLGTGGFMAVGAYACYKFMTGLDIWIDGVQYALPPINIFFSVILAGLVTAVVVFCLACRASASKASTLRLQHWLRSSSLFGCSTNGHGLITIPPPVRSTRLSVKSLGSQSRGRALTPGRLIFSAWS